MALEYIGKYRDLLHGEDELAILKEFLYELESPGGRQYGGREENQKLMREFCLHVAAKYFDAAVRDIAAE